MLRTRKVHHNYPAVLALCGLVVFSSGWLTTGASAAVRATHGSRGHIAAATGAGTTMTGTLTGDPPSLDPAKGFDPISWSFMHATFVTLITFTTAMRIVPWGATSLPTISDGGLVYTFKLRTGLKFTDGEPVTAQTYADGIERILTPKTKALVMAFYKIIKGATAYSEGKAKTVSGIDVINATTIQFTLTKPDRVFEDLMAIPNAAAVPPSYIVTHTSTFGLHPVGDGPYIVQSYVPGREITLVKNEEYFDAKTVPTKTIDITIGLTPATQVLRVENGESDVMLDSLTTAAYISVRNNSRYSKDLHHFSFPQDNYVALNMRKAPFTNKLVREAVAYAVNDTQVIRSIAGMGTPLTQIEAPGMPGYDPSVKPLGYDVVKAEALLKKAGHPGGKGIPKLTFLVATDGYTAGINVAEVIQQDLKQIGITVQIKALAPGAFLSSIGRYPMTMGIYGFTYPDPYDLVASQFSCTEITAGNNWAFYCNHAVDNTLASSLALTLTKAIPVYQKLQTQILSTFPWIPLFYNEFYYMVSPNVKGFGVTPFPPLLFAKWRI